jgi:hypothetical protein
MKQTSVNYKFREIFWQENPELNKIYTMERMYTFELQLTYFR